MLGVFFKDKTEYDNQLNPVKGYLEQLTSYIMIKKGVSVEVAKAKAIAILRAHFKDRPIKYFEREENGDRGVKDGTLLGYIQENIKGRNILVPTFTSYMNSGVEKSILSEFIFVNVKKRSIAKKAGQKAKAEGNLDLAEAKNNEQNTMKTYNNSLSGVFGQAACVMFNPTAHNTLTSMTRTMTSLSNANNEKLIAGNRYYPRPIDVLNNIIYIATYTDENKIIEAVAQYGLYLPSVEDVVGVLQYSSDLYFYDRQYYANHIVPFLEKLSPYQRAAICYSGDLYHLRKFNSNFMKKLLGELVTRIDCENEPLADVNVIHTIDESIVNLVHTIFFEKIKGFGKDYEKMNAAGLAHGIYKTALHVMEVLNKYKLLFNVFFMSGIFPSNSFRLKNMRRRTVVLSDTDSTCFTLDEWVTWYKGTYHIDSESIAMAGAVAFITSQTIVNSLAIVSRNMNIETDLLNTLAMKNEYLWLSHAPCSVSKHYFAQTVMQEGNVFSSPDIEMKGVHLKNSAVPKAVLQHSKDIIKYILDTVSGNGKVKLNKIIGEIIALEQQITESVKRGEAVYLKKSKIKSKEAYAQDEFKSPYQRHQFWLDVWAPKYGPIEDTPYDVIKVPTVVNSKVSYIAWLDSIEDLELKARLIDWMERYQKKDLPTIYLNETYVQGNGIPAEIISVINLKQIIFDMTMQHRLVLETLGVLLHEDKLVSEQFQF